jgi:L-threonylcarbamoyladenylate synthase
MVLRRRDHIPGVVTAGLPTVGLRVPDHPVARTLIRAAGVPLAAPSANPFGRISPTRAAHVATGLGRRVDLILDGGPCRVGVESTVILLAEGRAILLRPGGLPAEAIEAEIGPLRVLADDVPDAVSLAPGRAGAHYAPRARVILADPADPSAAAVLRAAPGEVLGLLAATADGRRAAERVGGPFAAVEVLSPTGDPVVVAAHLFEALHALETAGVTRIVAQPVPEVGLGRAVMDRLRRAAQGPR